MTVRATSILTLAALMAAASGGRVLAQSKAAEMVRNRGTGPEVTFRCRHEDGSAKLLCSQTAPAPPTEKKPLVEPEAAFATSLSLYTARNLATKETTAKFLRGLTGSEKVVNKVTPRLMQLSKSAPGRYGLAIAVLGTGALVVYEHLGGDNKAEAKPVDDGTFYLFPNQFRKIGEIDSEGNLRESAPAINLLGKP